MHRQPQIARDVSYASSASSAGGKLVIRTLENATGRLKLIKRVAGYQREVDQGRDFWNVMIERYGLKLDIRSGSLEAIPSSGPLVVVSNHPYGILDGMVLGHILSSTRKDFRILAHAVFRKAPDLEKTILPISFDGSNEAVKLNLETRKEALKYLSAGGAIGVFPGGTVATAPKPLATPLDPVWRTFTAKMIAKSEAKVVPVFFHGHTSRLFQLASHLNYTLRMGLMIREFRARVDGPVGISVGNPIPQEELSPFCKDPQKLMDYLRQATYALGPAPYRHAGYGYEFEARWTA